MDWRRPRLAHGSDTSGCVPMLQSSLRAERAGRIQQRFGSGDETPPCRCHAVGRPRPRSRLAIHRQLALEVITNSRPVVGRGCTTFVSRSLRRCRRLPIEVAGSTLLVLVGNRPKSQTYAPNDSSGSILRHGRHISKRLCDLPPPELVADALSAGEDETKTVRIWWSVRELRRIKEAGAELHQDAESWLETKVREFPDFGTRPTEHSVSGLQTSSWHAPVPDDSYDLLAGLSRLRTLERALSRGTGGGVDHRAGAREWLQLAG